jgi:hypothetical protein
VAAAAGAFTGFSVQSQDRYAAAEVSRRRRSRLRARDRKKVVGRHRRILSAENEGVPSEANGKDPKRTVSLLPTAPTYGGSDLEVYRSSSSTVAVSPQSLGAGAGRRPDRAGRLWELVQHDELLCIFGD